MYREEILDMAMDILDNTDATLEEAMGVALESQMRKMKAEARKTGDWSKVAKRQELMNDGRLESDRRTNEDALKERNARKDKPQVRRLADKVNRSINQNPFRRDDGTRRNIRYLKNSDPVQGVNNMEEGITAFRMSNMDRFSRKYGNGSGIEPAVKAHNGRGIKYRPKASKEAAIMDTALDFLDMYDVSLEEAIDMAYDYLID